MKTGRKRKGTTIEPSTVSNANKGGIRLITTTKKIGGQRHKAMGKKGTCLIEKDEHHLSSSTKALCHQLPVKEIGPPETTLCEPTFEVQPGQTLQTLAKIKLQLFPIDEGTRMGLEKDGHNPHLELTLQAQKKISSVLKHLNKKWGGSSIAVGELMLFPFNIQIENLAAYRRWTLKDSGASALDVYAAIESPTIFRLRYGWFSNLEPKTFRIPPTSSRFEVCSQSKNMKKGISENVEIMNGEKQQFEVTTQDYRPINISDAPNVMVGGPLPSDMATEPVDNLRVYNGPTLSSSAWADSLTNISIGGLLSEASLQGKPNRCYPMPIGSDPCLQQIPFSSDSFDAAIATHIYGHPQCPRSSSHGSHTSILDAEETCHAFSFQKFFSSGKEVLASSRSAPGACGQDASSRPFKFPSVAEVSTQAELMQDHARQESKADLPPQSQVHNDESSLGLADINWSDSLGSLDLGLSSSSRQLISGNSISLGGLLSGSLDAFQSCSFFVRDGKVPPT
ncbi:hypothetical protein HHK36_009345 [Tetracentron sinense]|uniref:TSL-kinase interacting protein 1 n=1 Tax=Tetracentron sinense TaxID=13715 RepID=A0A834ZF28_TETSI|nr:hypothetical protein HHK36_009345 [Tetracentron sinense]